jgi:fucose permease
MHAPYAAVSRLLVVLSACAFISLGLPDGLLGVAWPSIRHSFDRELDALGVLLVMSTCGYIASSFASGRVIRRANLGAVLAVSCALTSIALLGYAASSDWRLLILLAAVLGLGGGAVDAALNTYAATHHGARTLNLLHACYGVGAMLGPIVMTAVLTRGQPWQRGYAIVGAAQALLAAAFAVTIRQWPRTSGTQAATDTPAATLRATLKLPATQLGALVFIVYAGVEVSIGAWIYTLLTLGRGVAAPVAGALASAFWGGLTAGRVLAATAGAFVPVNRLLSIAIAGVAVGTVLIWVGGASAWTVAGVGIAGCACGPIFPMLVATTPARVGPAHTANAVGVQIAASGIGVSVVPATVGIIAEQSRIEAIAMVFVGLALLLMLSYSVLEWATASRPAGKIGSQPQQQRDFRD